jgi:hypothetical protein
MPGRANDQAKRKHLIMDANVTSLSYPNQQVFVLQVRPSPKAGAVKAYADLRYHAGIIKGFSIVLNKNGGYFVGFPSNFSNGKRFPIVEFTEPERSQIAKLILEAAKELLQ